MKEPQTLNKYEIVSQLRKYKHEIIDLSPVELDVFLPLIKGFIYSIDSLKEAFELQLQDYNDIIKSEHYKQTVSEFITYMKSFLKKSKGEYYEFLFTSFEKCSIIGLNDAEIRKEQLKEIWLAIDLFFFSIEDMIKNEIDKTKEFYWDYYDDVLGQLVYNTLDFKIFDADEFTPFKSKRTNFLKVATFNVLSHLENIALNNEEEAKQINEEIKKALHEKALPIPRRLKNEHIEFMKLRKTLDNNKYADIAKKMNGNYSVNSLKRLAKEINDTLGSNDIDQAIRNFESQCGAL